MSLLMEALKRAEQAEQEQPAASVAVDWERELDEFERANLDLVADIVPEKLEIPEIPEIPKNSKILENSENSENEELYWEPGIFAADPISLPTTPDILTAKRIVLAQEPPRRLNYVWMLLLLPLAFIGYYAGENVHYLLPVQPIQNTQKEQQTASTPVEPIVTTISAMSAPKAVITNEVLNKIEPEPTKILAQPAPIEPPAPTVPTDPVPIKESAPVKQDIKIVRNNNLNDNYQRLQRAYQAFNRGDDQQARNLYQTVLQHEPRNREALLGLAALAQRAARHQQAIDYYQQVLHYYPNDSTAQLGLQMARQTNLSSSQIKILLDDSPNTAILHFNLGNSYASQGNWAAAQQAYFDAYRLDENKADYAYNLAVSLEHLQQPKTALNYYQTALTLSRNQAINFSPQQVANRIKQLSE